MVGRRPIYKSRTLYTFSIESELLEKLKEIAEREGKPVNQILQKLIADYVEKHGAGNPNFRIDDFVEERVVKAYPTLGHSPDKFDLSGFDKDELDEMLRQAKKWEEKIAMAKAEKQGIEVLGEYVLTRRYRCLSCLKPFKSPRPAEKCPYCGSEKIQLLGEYYEKWP